MADLARAHLRTLESADASVELGPVGVAAYVSDACRAYEALAVEPSELARLEPDLVRLVSEGSPGAIVYGALLLRRLGRDVAPLLAAYRDDRRECTVFPGGCSGTTHWLSEAVRWVVTGEHWSHPARLLAHQLEALGRASWFELPSKDLIEATRAGRRRDGRAASGRWVFTFVELMIDLSKLRQARADLDRLLVDPALPVRLYAALLIRESDRQDGEAALETLARAGGEVPLLVRTWGGLSTRTKAVPVVEVVSELARWPG